MLKKLRGHGFGISMAVLWVVAVTDCVLNFTYVDGPFKQPYLVGVDNNCYFAFAHSLFFDRDVNFANQYHFLASTQPLATAKPFISYLEQNPGNPMNHFNAGTGIAALPFIAMGWCVSCVIGWMRGSAVSPFVSWYPLVYLVGNLTYGVLALYVTGRTLRRRFSTPAAAFAVWAVLLCGPAFYYFFGDIAMSHLTSAFFVSLAVMAWTRWRERAFEWNWAIVFGVSAGFGFTVRSLNVALILLLLERVIAVLREPGERRKLLILPVVLAGAAYVTGVFPQLLSWRIQHGKWIANPVEFSWQIIPPYALKVLFSERHGLFFWAPALLVSAVGLIIAPRTRRAEAWWLILVLGAVTWIYGNWRIWWLGVSFGNRGYVDFIPIFAYGFASMATLLKEWLARNAKSLRTGIALCWEFTILFFIINLHLWLSYRGGLVYVDGPLRWNDTVDNPVQYHRQLAREWTVRTDFSRGFRTNLFESPKVRPATRRAVAPG